MKIKEMKNSVYGPALDAVETFWEKSRKLLELREGQMEVYETLLLSRLLSFPLHQPDSDISYGIPYRYYAEVVVPHKLAVVEEGMRIRPRVYSAGIRDDRWKLRLLFHDVSKFSSAELAFANHRYGKDDPTIISDALHHHYQNNDHHPQWWISATGEALEMSAEATMEMIVDWVAAGKTHTSEERPYGTPLEEWAPKNIGRFRFHPGTYHRVSQILAAEYQVMLRPYSKKDEND